MKNLFTLTVAILLSHFSVFSSPLKSFTGDFAQLRSNLYIVAKDGSTVLMDGSLTQYYSEYSNQMDAMDARKMSNPSENWGMMRNNTVYVIERRHIIEGNDSIFFKIWNMRIITYRIEFITSNLNFPGRTGVLEDKFLKASTPINLSGNTYIDFSVTSDPASKASDRFRIIFSNTTANGLLPLDFIFANAIQKNNSVNINWQTENEENVKEFNIERSSDGINFQKSNTIEANKTHGLNQYQYIDEQPKEGDNYYRISGVGIGGGENISNILKVNVEKEIQKIILYPNPATGNNLNLQMINQPAGLYTLRLINSFGQTFMTKRIQFQGGSGIQKIQPSQTVPTGIYQLEIKLPDGKRYVFSVVF